MWPPRGSLSPSLSAPAPCTLSEYQSVLLFFRFHHGSGPDDLTFKWQLLPDLFRNVAPSSGPAHWDEIRRRGAPDREHERPRSSHRCELWKHDRKGGGVRRARVGEEISALDLASVRMMQHDGVWKYAGQRIQHVSRTQTVEDTGALLCSTFGRIEPVL